MSNPYTIIETVEAKLNDAFSSLAQLKAQLSKPKVPVSRVYKKLDEKFNKRRKREHIK